MDTKQEITDYVRESLQRGATSEEIRRNLIAYNWTNEEINEAFLLAQREIY